MFARIHAEILQTLGPLNANASYQLNVFFKDRPLFEKRWMSRPFFCCFSRRSASDKDMSLVSFLKIPSQCVRGGQGGITKRKQMQRQPPKPRTV